MAALPRRMMREAAAPPGSRPANLASAVHPIFASRTAPSSLAANPFIFIVTAGDLGAPAKAAGKTLERVV